MFKALRLLGVAFAVMLLLLLQRSCTPASASSGLETRISRLESENLQLRAQLSRLETQLSRLAGVESRPPARVNQPAPPPDLIPPSQRPQSLLGDDPMFKRLATLVVELKERVVALENRLNQQ